MNQVRIIPPELLLEGYSHGLFPMSEERNDPGVEWFSARRRGVIPLDSFRVSRNVMRIIRQNRYHCKINTRFREVIERCAERDSTWISDLIIDSYEVLHLAGHAHSVELYNEQVYYPEDSMALHLEQRFLGSRCFGQRKRWIRWHFGTVTRFSLGTALSCGIPSSIPIIWRSLDASKFQLKRMKNSYGKH